MGQDRPWEDAEITAICQTLDIEPYRATSVTVPVGCARSLKPYAFTHGPWELSKTESIDVIGRARANIRVDYQSAEVMRVPCRATTTALNEEWIFRIKTRFRLGTVCAASVWTRPIFAKTANSAQSRLARKRLPLPAGCDERQGKSRA